MHSARLLFSWAKRPVLEREAATASVEKITLKSIDADLEIRDARPKDRRKIIALIDRVCNEKRYLQTPHYSPTLLWEVLLHNCFDADAGLWLYVVTHRKKIIGFGRLLPDKETTGHCPVGNVGIVLASEWRGRKIGTFLLAKLLKTAYIVGYHFVRADILSTNQRSINLFRKHGFKKLDVHTFFWPVKKQVVNEMTMQRSALPVDTHKTKILKLDGGNAPAT